MSRPLRESPGVPHASLWHPPPEEVLLPRDEVHVWRVALDLEPARVRDLMPILSPDECARAERFYSQKDGRHFTVGRAVLRAILGLYLRMKPEHVPFRYSAHGKPEVASACSRGALRFNLSHSHNLALCAVARERPVGVDIEHIRDDPDRDRVAERFFSPHETAALRALPANARREAFFACWTRKEAYVKARGEGLSLRLDQFSVSVGPLEPAGLLSASGDPAEAARWSLTSLAPGPGYLAALAVEGHGWRLKCWQWPA